MAGELISLNPDQLKTLLREIEVEHKFQKPNNKIVILDWVKALEEFRDAEGSRWSAAEKFYSMDSSYAGLRTKLTSESGRISVVIGAHSLKDGQKAAIEEALSMATNTSAPFLSHKVAKSCFSDLCLVPRQGDSINYMIFIYGNILIELVHSDKRQGVQPVAHYLQSVMEKAVENNPKQNLPSRQIFNYSVKPAQIKVGKTFTVTVTPGYDQKAVSFDVDEDMLSENVEYEEDLGDDVYKFTAKTAGAGTVAFSVMDKKTLWTFTDMLTVNIDY